MNQSVEDLTSALAEHIQHAIPSTVTVTGTLSTWRRGKAWANGEIATFKPGTTTPVARLRIGVPGRTAAVLERRFREQGTPLGAGCVVTVVAQPEFHSVYGLRLVVKTIHKHEGPDHNSATRTALIAQLQAEQWGIPQQTMAWPQGDIKLGLVTPSGGDAAQSDVESVLSQHDQITIIERRVPMTGSSATASISRALAQLVPAVDGLLVVRGGGAATDMLVWDTAAVVKAVATCGRPVILGVGHAQDTTVADLVAYHAAATPTAAAMWVSTQTRLTQNVPNLCPQRTQNIPYTYPSNVVAGIENGSSDKLKLGVIIALTLMALAVAVVVTVLLSRVL